MQGLTLPEYVAIKAGLGEGFGEREVLDAEGVEARRFSRADPLWKVRLVDDRAAFAAYEIELAAAEDWLDREVSPLCDDPAAWASFLSAFATDGAEVLAVHGLRLSDVARLRRRWAQRSEQEPKLDQRIAEYRRQPVALPPIRVAPAVLRPSRYARGRAQTAAQATPLAAESPSLSLDQYAALCAEIAAAPADSARALARHGIADELALAELDRRWRSEMDRDPLIAADFRRLFAHNRARLSVQTRAATPGPAREVSAETAPEAGVFHAAPTAIRSALRGTSLALDLPRGPALPFAAAAPAVPSREAEPSLPSSPSPAGSLTGTVLSLDGPKGEALPFVTSPPSGADGQTIGLPSSTDARLATRSTPKLGETSPLVDVARGPALPFGATPGPGTGASLTVDVPRGDSVPFARGEAPRPSAQRPVAPAGAPGLGVTADLGDVPRGPAMPFATGVGPRPKKSKLAERSMSLQGIVRPEATGGSEPRASDEAPKNALAAKPAEVSSLAGVGVVEEAPLPASVAAGAFSAESTAWISIEHHGSAAGRGHSRASWDH